MLKDARAVEPLLGAVRDPQAEPSAEAIRALATLGDSRAIETLMDVVRNPNGFFLPIARRAAVIALAQFPTEPVTSLLRAVSEDPSEDMVIRDAATPVIVKA
jgi:HEAT repeat protein